VSEAAPKVLAVIVADFERSAIGTRSRLLDTFNGQPVLAHVLMRAARIEGVGEIALLVPESQRSQAQSFQTPGVTLHSLTMRAAHLSARVRIGRAWNLLAWRGGAGQWTAFDEDYHPAAIAAACASAFPAPGPIMF
jgi:hypothetical protein